MEVRQARDVAGVDANTLQQRDCSVDHVSGAISGPVEGASDALTDSIDAAIGQSSECVADVAEAALIVLAALSPKRSIPLPMVLPVCWMPRPRKSSP